MCLHVYWFETDGGYLRPRDKFNIEGLANHDLSADNEQFCFISALALLHKEDDGLYLYMYTYSIISFKYVCLRIWC